MKVLVTGANSLLATNIIVDLLERDYRVKAMVRDKSKLLLSNPGIEICLGDITDKTAVSNAVKDCDIVIHVAANTGQDARDYFKFKKVNVGGTAHVLEAADKRQVKRVVLVSSANAFAYGTKENPGDESKKISHPFSKSFYGYSKYEAQQYALNQLDKISPEIVIVNPTFMLGKYDAKPSSGQIITRGYKKRFILAPSGGKNYVHVKDAAEAICNAIDKGRSGESYLLANKNMSYREFYEKMVKVTGQKSSIIILPKSLLLFVGHIGSLLTKLGISVEFHLANMQILCVRNYYTNQKAKTELGLKETSISKAIEDAVDWFKEKGMVK